MTAGPTGDVAYRVQVDTLRAIAVLAVIFSHSWDAFGGFGHHGVRLFFVISGFLITGILLDRHRGYGGPQPSTGRVLAAFYARRALRIFPIYYLLVLALVLAGSDRVTEDLVWYLTHTVNILFTSINAYDPWYTAHVWSLSIEEQFYLVWPLLLLATPRRWVPALLLATVLAGVLTRVVLVFHPLGEVGDWVVTPVAFDALGMGALVALAHRHGMTWWLSLPVGAVALVFGLALALGRAGDLGDSPFGYYVAADAILTYPMAVVVHRAYLGFGGVTGRLLGHPVPVMIGRMSYGLYLFHFPAMKLLFDIAGAHLPNGPVRCAAVTVTTIAISAVSWFAIERPILGLKRLFPYERPASLAPIGRERAPA